MSGAWQRGGGPLAFPLAEGRRHPRRLLPQYKGWLSRGLSTAQWPQHKHVVACAQTELLCAGAQRLPHRLINTQQGHLCGAVLSWHAQLLSSCLRTIYMHLFKVKGTVVYSVWYVWARRVGTRCTWRTQQQRERVFQET